MPRLKCKPQNAFIGKNAKNKSEIGILEKKLIDQQNTIEGAKTVLIEKQQELDSLKSQLKDISRQIDNNRRKLCHKREKLQGITEIVSNVSATISSKQKLNKNVFAISKLTAAKRKLNPSNENLPKKAKCVRQNETYEVCKTIHGGTETNTKPTVDGILDTLTSKVKADELSEKVLNSKPALVKKLSKTCVNKWSKDYYISKENTLRSLNIYYSKNVMGKRKYQSMRKANQKAFFQGSKITNVVSYQNLSKEINSIEIGELISISPSLTYDLENSGSLVVCTENVVTAF